MPVPKESENPHTQAVLDLAWLLFEEWKAMREEAKRMPPFMQERVNKEH